MEQVCPKAWWKSPWKPLFFHTLASACSLVLSHCSAAFLQIYLHNSLSWWIQMWRGQVTRATLTAWTDLSQPFAPCFTSLISPDQDGDHLWRGQVVLVVALRIWTEGKVAKWFQTRATSNKHSLPPPTPTSDSFSKHNLFAKWKPPALRSLSINLKRLDDQWHRRHSIFLLNWANQLICFGCSGILGWWQKQLKGRPVGSESVCLFT